MSLVRGPFESDIRELSLEELNDEKTAKNYNPNHESDGRFGAGTGGGGSLSVKRSVSAENDKILIVKHEIRSKDMWTTSDSTTLKETLSHSGQKGDTTVNTSASGNLSVKKAKAFKSMVDKSNGEAKKQRSKYGGKADTESSSINSKVREDGYQKHTEFSVATDNKTYAIVTATQKKVAGDTKKLSTDPKDSEINISASGSLSVEHSETYSRAIGYALKTIDN